MKKKLLALLLGTCMTLSLFGCGSSADTASSAEASEETASEETASEETGSEEAAESGEDKSEINVGFSLNEQRFIFYGCMADYAQKAANEFGEEHGVTFNWDVTSADTDTGKQSSDITDLINKDVDVMVMIPIDSVAIHYSIKECHEAGIPVITTCRLEDRNTDDPEEKADVFVSLNAEDQAYVPTCEVFDQMIAAGYKPEEINCLEMVGNLNDEIATARSNGFNKAAEEYGVNIIQQEVFEWNADKALSICSAAIVAHPEINMIFMAHDSNMPAIETALTRNNRWVKTGEEGHVYIASCDGDSAGLTRIESGYVDAIGNYEHWAICEQLVEAINELANGRSLPQDTYEVAPRLLTQANLAEQENLWGKDFSSNS